MTFAVTRDTWRYVVLVGAAPALLTFIIRLFVPESDRWLQAAATKPTRPLAEIFADVPSHEFARSVLDGDGLPLVEAFVRTGLAATNSRARQTIEQGGAYVNNRRVADVTHRLTTGDLVGTSTLVLRSGKKSYAIARFS